jgi:hypothetical protein
MVAAFSMLGQVASFGGLLPFPMFLAFIAVGMAALLSARGSQRQRSAG